MTRSGH